MLELSTLYLLLAMGSFVCIAVVLVHRHNCADTIQRKRNEVQSTTELLQKKIQTLEQEVVDIELKIDEVDQQIDTMKE